MSSFRNMKRLGVRFLMDANPSQGCIQHAYSSPVSIFFFSLEWREALWKIGVLPNLNTVKWPRQGSNPNRSICNPGHLPLVQGALKVKYFEWIELQLFVSVFVLFKLVSIVRVVLSIWPDWLDSTFQGAFLPELNHDVDWRKRLRQHKTSIWSVGQFLTTCITPSVKVSSRIWHPPIRTDIVCNQIVVTIIMCIATPAIQIRTNHLIIHSLKPGSHLWDKHNTSEISTSISTRKRNMFLFSRACAYAYFTCVMLISQARIKL